MDKRKDLRDYYQNQEERLQNQNNFNSRTEQIDDFETTVVNAFNSLIRYMNGSVSKTEVINQLDSVKTPDVQLVVDAIKQMDSNLSNKKTDNSEIMQAFASLKSELEKFPKELPKFEQLDTIKVSNLSELDFSKIENAIKNIKFEAKPVVDVKAPIINVEKMDTKPLQDIMLDVVKYIKAIKYPEIPKTDLSKLEKLSTDSNKKIDESNKLLKKIVDKPVGGGGGGGGNGTPYVDSDGIAKNVELTSNGRIPIDIDMVAEDISTASNQTNGSQITRITDSWGNYIGSTMADELMVSEKRRVAGGVFNGTVPDTNFYTTSLSANGTATISNSVLDLATTIDSGSSVLIYTNGVGRYIGGSMNHLRGIIRVGNVGATNNTVRFGVTSTSSLADSLFFEVSNSTLSINAKTTGLADIKVSSGSFNGVSPTYTLNGQYVTIEILYTNKTIEFYINKNLIHTLTETTDVICGTRHLRPFMQNYNTGVGGVSHLYCQVLSLLTWGEAKTQPKYYFQQGTTTGILLKTGIGSLHMMNLSGVNNNSVVTIYDGLTSAGSVIYTTGAMGAQTAPLSVVFNTGVQFINGLYLVISGANCNCQVMYE